MLALLVAAASTSAPHQVHLTLGGDATSVGVSWRTAKREDSPTVEYAQEEGGQSLFVTTEDSRTYEIYGATSGFYHHAVLEVKPASDYWYRVVGSDALYNFSSLDDSVKSARLVFTGDYGMGGHTEKPQLPGPPRDGDGTARAWAALAAERVRNTFLWVAGDIAYPNLHGASDFESTWNDWFSTLEPAFAAAPLLVTPGNHETYLPVAPNGSTGASTGAVRESPARFFENDEELNPGDKAWNFTAFDARFAMPSEPSGGARNMWYSVDVGGAHFVSIDTETDFPGAAEDFLGGWGGGGQLQWFERDLAAYRSRSADGWLVVVGHKPIYSGAPDYYKHDAPAAEFANIQKHFEPLFAKYGVHVYLAGHQHGYERTVPVRDSKPAAGGTTYIVAAIPGGGCGITADWPTPRPSWNAARFPETSPWLDSHDITAEKADLGYGILEVNETALAWRMVLAESGKVVDRVVMHR